MNFRSPILLLAFALHLSLSSMEQTEPIIQPKAQEEEAKELIVKRKNKQFELYKHTIKWSPEDPQRYWRRVPGINIELLQARDAMRNKPFFSGSTFMEKVRGLLAGLFLK